MKRSSFFAWILLIALLLCACDGMNALPEDTSSLENDNTTVQKVELVSNGKAKYKIIVPENCDDSITEAADALKSKLKKITNSVFSVMDDHTLSGKVEESSGEIIIGNCKRVEMQTALSELTYRDYSVSITESNILIAGHDTSNVSEAVYAFIKAIEDDQVEKSDDKIVLHWSGNIVKKYTTYKFNELKLSNVSLDQYSIIYPTNGKTKKEVEFYKNYAFELQRCIGLLCGYVLDVKPDTETPKECEILIGKVNRTESLEFYASEKAPDSMEYGLARKNKKLMVYAGGLFSLDSAVQMLNNQITTLKSTDMDVISDTNATRVNRAISKNTGEYRFMTYNVLYEVYGEGGFVTPDVEIRKEPVSYLINQYAPDVLALEECFYNWHYQLPELLGEEYEFVCAKRSDGEVNRTPMLYRKDRLNLVDSGYVDLEKTITNNRRVITWAIFESKENGERFAVLATHWDPFSNEALLSSSTVMAELAMKFQTEQNLPVIAMGDFNSKPTRDSYINFHRMSGLAGVTATDGVDHVFYSKEFSLVSQGIETENCARMASDHFPVWIDLNLD